MVSDFAGVRRQLEELLGFTLQGQLWSMLMQRGYISQVTTGARSVGALVDEIRDWQRALTAPERVSQGGMGPATTNEPLPDGAAERLEATSRELALQALFADLAAREQGVRAFRAALATDLPVFHAAQNHSATATPASTGRPWLEPEEVRDWVAWRERIEGPPTWWLTGQISAPQVGQLVSGERGEAQVTVAKDQALARLRLRLLRYRVRPDEPVRVTATTSGLDAQGVPYRLEWLRRLSVPLARRYGWDVADAALFLLCATPPPVPPVRARTQFNRRYPAAGRVQLDVDPTLSAREVSAAYYPVRQHVLGAHHRDLSSKHLALARFAALHPKETVFGSATWSELMGIWNDEQRKRPHYQYKQVTNFARDYQLALRRLLYPTYHPL